MQLTISPDQDSLGWILNLADVIGRLAQWRLLLSKFDTDFLHRAGINIQTSEALSRPLTEWRGVGGRREDYTPLENERSVFMVKQGNTFADIEHSTFAQESDVGTPLQPVTKAVVNTLKAPSLAEFFKSQAANAFCRTASKELGKAGT